MYMHQGVPNRSVIQSLDKGNVVGTLDLDHISLIFRFLSIAG